MKSFGLGKVFLTLIVVTILVFSINVVSEAYFGGLYGLGMYGGMYGLGSLGMYGLGSLGMYWPSSYYGFGLNSLYGMGGLYGLGGMYGLYGLYGGYGGLLGGLYGLGGLGLYGGLYGIGGLGYLGSLGLLGGLGGLSGLTGLEGAGTLLSNLFNISPAVTNPVASPIATASSVLPFPPLFLAEQIGTWLGIWSTGILSGQMTLNLIEDPLLGTLLGTAQLLGNPTLGALVDVTGEVINAQVILSGSAIGLGGMTFGLDIIGILIAPDHMIGTYNIINLSSGGTIVEQGSIDLGLITPII